VGSLALAARFGLDQGFDSYDDDLDAARGLHDDHSTEERRAGEVSPSGRSTS
jgi:hypothetical protein